MNSKTSIQTILLLGTILGVGMIGVTSHNALVYAGNGGGNDDNSGNDDKNCNDNNHHSSDDKNGNDDNHHGNDDKNGNDGEDTN